MISRGQFTLAFESAIGGGSISLLDEGMEVANWIGESNVLRAAEELLPKIDRLLGDNDIATGDVGLIAVSAGPGSFTGIRIGLATALGLKTGLGIPMASASALTAMAFAQQNVTDFIAAVPAGRNAVCWQRFTTSRNGILGVGEPAAMAEEEFARMAIDESGAVFVVHEAMANIALPNVIDFGANMAKAIGIYCRTSPYVQTEPLFISKNF